MKSNLSILFSLVPCAFGVVSKKSLPNAKLQRFTPISSCKSFIALALALRFQSRIHLELIFMRDV